MKFCKYDDSYEEQDLKLVEVIWKLEDWQLREHIKIWEETSLGKERKERDQANLQNGAIKHRNRENVTREPSALKVIDKLANSQWKKYKHTLISE